MASTERSAALFARAQAVTPGGVNSPVRAFAGVGGTPRFMVRGEGSTMWDADGAAYIDYVGSWGPHLFGHGHPAVLEALRAQVERGTSFGAPTEGEVVLADLICQLVPSVDMVRLVNSGTEATMSAVRVARAATKRERFVKFEGCYHGHGDEFLIAAGSGVLTLGVPGSPGVTKGTAADTLLARYNDLASVEKLFRDHPGEIAAVIVEPVVGNMGVIIPEEGFLPGLRAICDREGAILIFDEVMTGFRVAPGGAQERYGVRPDLTTLGKVIGGGLPVGAYGGRADLMRLVAPAGPVYQAGTLSGNPLAVAAGIAMLRAIIDERPHEKLEKTSAAIADGLGEILTKRGITHTINRVGSMGTVFFAEGPVRDYESAKRSDTARFAKFFHAMLEGGVYLPPSQFEAYFVSAAHSPADIERTLDAARKAIAHL